MLIIVGLLNCGLRMGGVDETLIGAVILLHQRISKQGGYLVMVKKWGEINILNYLR